MIFRMYEAHDMRTKARIQFGFDVDRVWVCDLMENRQYELEVRENGVGLEIGNFEIVTLKVIS